jgi:hypothetical protein
MAKKERKQLTDAEKADKRQARKDANRARFLNLAPKRVNNTLKCLRNLARCANTNSYEFSQEEANKIIYAIERQTEAMIKQFEGGPNGEPEFTLE